MVFTGFNCAGAFAGAAWIEPDVNPTPTDREKCKR